jgi:hypothetical protein
MTLQEAKDKRFIEIKNRTNELIEAGFEFDASGLYVISLNKYDLERYSLLSTLILRSHIEGVEYIDYHNLNVIGLSMFGRLEVIPFSNRDELNKMIDRLNEFLFKMYSNNADLILNIESCETIEQVFAIEDTR